MKLELIKIGPATSKPDYSQIKFAKSSRTGLLIVLTKSWDYYEDTLTGTVVESDGIDEVGHHSDNFTKKAFDPYFTMYTKADLPVREVFSPKRGDYVYREGGTGDLIILVTVVEDDYLDGVVIYQDTCNFWKKGEIIQGIPFGDVVPFPCSWILRTA